MSCLYLTWYCYCVKESAFKLKEGILIGKQRQAWQIYISEWTHCSQLRASLGFAHGVNIGHMSQTV